jgi:trans-aconitate methyltransferase
MSINKWNTSLYDQKHSFVFEYGKELISLLNPQPGEKILDIGSGTGHLTNQIAQAGAHIIGIDSSSEMIQSAQQTYPHLQFIEADIRTFSSSYKFDAIFSNAVLHWINDAESVVVNISKLLRSGGRLVVEFGGKGNISNIQQGLREVLKDVAGIEDKHSNYYPSIGEYTSLLEKYKIVVTSAMLFDRPTKLEDGINGLRNWIMMFRGEVFKGLDEETKEQILGKVEERLRPLLFKDGNWYADYRRLRIVAYKE